MSVKKWVMSDEGGGMSDEWRKLSDEKSLPKQALIVPFLLQTGVNGSTQQRLNPNQSMPTLIPLDRPKTNWPLVTN